MTFPRLAKILSRSAAPSLAPDQDEGVSMPQTFEDRLAQSGGYRPTGPGDAPDRVPDMQTSVQPPQAFIRREDVEAAIQRAVGGAETSPVFTRNEVRAVRQIALFLQQTLGLPTTYGP